MKIDDWTKKHLLKYLQEWNPTNIDDGDLADKVIAWLENASDGDAQYWINRGWAACIDRVLGL